MLGLGFGAQVLLPWFCAEVLICPRGHAVLIIFANQGGLQKFTSSIRLWKETKFEYGASPSIYPPLPHLTHRLTTETIIL